GQGAAQGGGQGEDPVGEGVGDLVGGASFGQGDDEAEPGGPRGQGGYRALVALADDEVALPVAGHGPVGGLGGPFADADQAGDPGPAGVVARAGAALAGPAAAQRLVDLGAQAALALHEQRLVDR